MTTTRDSSLQDNGSVPVSKDRLIGEYGPRGNGPLVIVIACLHGNEPSGGLAVARLFDALNKQEMRTAGRIVAFVGNQKASARGVRFVKHDLNRMWNDEQLSWLEGRSPMELEDEDREQHELLACIENEARACDGPVFILDLHSTSGDGPPFCIISDTLQNRRIAFGLHLPVILGLEEAIRGTIQEFFGERGFVTAAIEGGQHDRPDTVDRLESVLWITFMQLGLLNGMTSAELGTHRDRLREAGKSLPAVVEVFHRHDLDARDEFEMLSGFANFSRVRRGEIVARDRTGDIPAPASGVVVLPSYQKLGSDGFFLGREVNRFWLRLSTVVRKLGLDRFLSLLPGVRRHPAQARVFLADPSVARFLVLKIFHLFGFQKRPQKDGHLVFRRRHEGPPTPRESV